MVTTTRRGPSWLRWGLFIVVIAVAGAAGGCASRAPAKDPRLGQRLTFAFPDANGRQMSESDFRGQVVLVDIWATWCKPCKMSLPCYVELHERLGPEGFRVVGISIDEEDELVADFLEEEQLPFPVLRDRNGALPEKMAAEAMPTAFLLDRQGRIAYVHEGFHDGDQAEIEQQIRAVLDAR